MKRKLRTLLGILTTLSVSATMAQDVSPSEPVYDSIYRWTWKTPSLERNNWGLSSKTVNLLYKSDTALLLSDTTLYWDGTNWINQSTSTNTYDSKNNLIQLQGQSWDGTQWVNGTQHLKTYDTNNNLTELLIQSWKSGNWEDFSRTRNVYDANNNKIESLNEFVENWKWTFNSRMTFTYDSSNKLIKDFVIERLGRNDERTYTYDANDNLISIDIRQFNNFDSSWTNRSRTTYMYDGNNNRIHELVETWTDSVLQATSQSFLVYDAQNNLTQRLNQIKEGTEWVNDRRTLNVYNANNQRTDNSDAWFSQGEIFYADSTHYFIKDIPAGIKVNMFNDAVFLYPNPSTGLVNIKVENNQTIQRIEVFNTIGEKVLEQRAGQLNMSASAKGIYFVRVYAGEQVCQQKMIIE
jgi:hypothetical protein